MLTFVLTHYDRPLSGEYLALVILASSVSSSLERVVHCSVFLLWCT